MKAEIVELILESLREQSAVSAHPELAAPTPETRLLGEKAVLDSIGLVSLIVDLEEKVAARFGKEIVLADERAMSLRYSPFRRVESLADYVVEKLEAAS